MSLLWIVVPSAVILLTAYFIYGSILARLFRLDPQRKTPADELQDGVDYEPLATVVALAAALLGHRRRRADRRADPGRPDVRLAAGADLDSRRLDLDRRRSRFRRPGRLDPPQGPLDRRGRPRPHEPAVVSAVPGVHLDRAGLHHRGVHRRHGRVVRRRRRRPKTATSAAAAIATSSLLYLALPIVMGLLHALSEDAAVAGDGHLPAAGGRGDLGRPVHSVRCARRCAGHLDRMPQQRATPNRAARSGTSPCSIYCLIAGVLPVWLLLQPRGHLGGYFLYAALGAGAIGLVFGGATSRVSRVPRLGASLRHGPARAAAVSAAVHHDRLRRLLRLSLADRLRHDLQAARSAKPTPSSIGYGSMLLEAMVAIVSLCCVMMFADGSPQLTGKRPNLIYAHGIGRFLEVLGISAAFGMSFALMAFTTFVYDTLDVCTRLGRYIMQELTGWQNRRPLVRAPASPPACRCFFSCSRHPTDAVAPARLADVLEPVRRKQPTAGRADAAGRHRLAVADAAGVVGVAGHRPADGVHVRDEHLGPDYDDAAGVLRAEAGSWIAAPPIPCRGSAWCCWSWPR